MPGRFAGLTPYEGYEDMLVEKRDGVVVATLNVPEKLNALTPGIRIGVKRVLEEVNDDEEAKALVITGAGRGFCSGADMGGGGDGAAGRQPSRQELEESRFGWVGRFRTIDKPVIAAINGVVAGGGFSLALAADVRVASDRARFVTAFMRRAILPDQCVTWLLPRVVGPSRALLMLWLSDDVLAEEAQRIGLVDVVTPHEQLMERTLELAARLVRGPSVTIELTKRALYHGLAVPLETQAEYEESLLSIVSRTEDVQEGRVAFRERRQPNFRGR
ncbi:MAG: enoyl-CoA hydratase/isomerase family protein [Chloroflexi bacterium]|nr:enoyl-CoA hydratase/isomerase family protein [Chloroflexota bacterium]